MDARYHMMRSMLQNGQLLSGRENWPFLFLLNSRTLNSENHRIVTVTCHSLHAALIFGMARSVPSRVLIHPRRGSLVATLPVLNSRKPSFSRRISDWGVATLPL